MGSHFALVGAFCEGLDSVGMGAIPDDHSFAIAFGTWWGPFS